MTYWIIESAVIVIGILCFFFLPGKKVPYAPLPGDELSDQHGNYDELDLEQPVRYRFSNEMELEEVVPEDAFTKRTRLLIAHEQEIQDKQEQRKVTKAAWYRKNKERVLEHQRQYRAKKKEGAGTAVEGVAVQMPIYGQRALA